jgi:hypothetical protein
MNYGDFGTMSHPLIVAIIHDYNNAFDFLYKKHHHINHNYFYIALMYDKFATYYRLLELNLYTPSKTTKLSNIAAICTGNFHLVHQLGPNMGAGDIVRCINRAWSPEVAMNFVHWLKSNGVNFIAGIADELINFGYVEVLDAMSMYRFKFTTSHLNTFINIDMGHHNHFATTKWLVQKLKIRHINHFPINSVHLTIDNIEELKQLFGLTDSDFVIQYLTVSTPEFAAYILDHFAWNQFHQQYVISHIVDALTVEQLRHYQQTDHIRAWLSTPRLNMYIFNGWIETDKRDHIQWACSNHITLTEHIYCAIEHVTTEHPDSDILDFIRIAMEPLHLPTKSHITPAFNRIYIQNYA